MALFVCCWCFFFEILSPLSLNCHLYSIDTFWNKYMHIGLWIIFSHFRNKLKRSLRRLWKGSQTPNFSRWKKCNLEKKRISLKQPEVYLLMTCLVNLLAALHLCLKKWVKLPPMISETLIQLPTCNKRYEVVYLLLVSVSEAVLPSYFSRSSSSLKVSDWKLECLDRAN